VESVTDEQRRHEPPEGPAIDRMLAAARSRFARLSPAAAHAAARDNGLIVDIRSERQRDRQGRVPGARFVPRNVLEWRADPTCPHHDPVLVSVEGPLILICAQGYQSSLAAAALIELGVSTATDVEGGYERWQAEGMPTVGGDARRSGKG
jgi:rhodanese-related sulfurtransferase